MDATAALQSIAKNLPNLTLEAAESMLVTFDSLAGLSSADARPGAAQMLRDAASQAADQHLRMRLLLAAHSVEAGEACARTPDGLTWQEAAAANTVDAANWHEPPLPAESQEPGEDGAPEMVDEPGRLPPLSVPNFFPGLAVRVGRELKDTRDRAVVPGSLLHLLKADIDEDGRYSLSFLECTLHLDDEEILRNAGNQWFQPVPTVECLTDLWETVNEHLDDVGELDEDREEWLDSIVDEVGQCEEWLLDDESSGPPPVCTSGPLAAKVFGRRSSMAVWVPLLFAGLALAARTSDDDPLG